MEITKIVILKERMKNEGRVALTPSACGELSRLFYNLSIYMEAGAGEQSGFGDIDYVREGVAPFPLEKLLPLFDMPGVMILKVKQPIPEDGVWLTCTKHTVLCAFFHSAGEKDQKTIEWLTRNDITGISYENIDVVLPAISPLRGMSEIAGRVAVDQAVEFSQKVRYELGFRAVDNEYLQMAIFGAGTVGVSAIKRAISLGFSSISVFEKDPEKENKLRSAFTEEEMRSVKFFSGKYALAEGCDLQSADIVVGAVLVPSAEAPIVVSKEHVDNLKKGCVIIDVSCDQGGCVWYPESEVGKTAFVYEGKYFSRIPNLPGLSPTESTPVFSDSIFPHICKILQNGIPGAFKKSLALQKGLLTYQQMLWNKAVADYYGKGYVDPETFFGSDDVEDFFS
jgi:alanine dehydrogenase